MKSTFFGYLIAVSTIFLAACNNNSGSKNSDTGISTKDSASNTSVSNTDDSDVKQEAPSFANVDPKAAASINEVISHYWHVKNALSADNSGEAASGAKAMVAALAKIDHGSLAPDQMKLYMDVAESLKEHAQHTADNGGNIEHQREHFVMMSDDVYDLVKGFGAEKPVYVDHCPMANNDKGANWLSETKEINRNPYMGKKMPKCGTVEGVIKK